MSDLSVDNKRMRRVRVDQWSPGIKMNWTPAQVQSALHDHQQGNFEAASKLATAMLQDDEIPQDLAISTNLIVGSDFRLEPINDEKGEPDPESQAIADEYKQDFIDAHPVSEMAKMFEWEELLGISVGVYDYYRRNGKWYPRFRCLNPENLWFDDGRVDPQTGLHGVFMYRARTGDEMVTPGDGRWVLWSSGRESWVSCGVRALGFDWYGKQQTFRDLMRYEERHGLPFVVAKVPSFMEDGTNQAVKRDVKAIGSDTVITIPSDMMPDSGQRVGMEIELVEAKDQAFEVFFRALDRFDRKIKMYFLGSNTSELEGTAGSRATQSGGRAIMMQKAQERYNRVKGMIKEQMLLPTLMLTRDVDLSKVPDPVYLIEADEDLKERAETQKTYVEMLNIAKASGYAVKNAESEARQYGLELEAREIEEEEITPSVPGEREGLNDGNTDAG